MPGAGVWCVLFCAGLAGYLPRPSSSQVITAPDGTQVQMRPGVPPGFVPCPRNAEFTLETLLGVYDDLAENVRKEDCERAKKVFTSIKELMYACLDSDEENVLKVMSDHKGLGGDYNFRFATVCGPPSPLNGLPPLPKAKRKRKKRRTRFNPFTTESDF